jgi:hypothetical protein
MGCNNLRPGCGNTNDAPIIFNSGCPDMLGCPPGICPDFTIRRRTTTPAFKVAVEDCDGPIDLRGNNIIVEASMWAKARLKHKIDHTHEHLSLADNIGFYQVMVNDIIVMDRIRSPEHMLVVGFDEDNKTIQVQRGHNGTTPSTWSKGSRLRIFKFMNAPATVEIIQDDETSPDGRTIPDITTDTFLVYEWKSQDTCLPGCYWIEFNAFEMEKHHEEHHEEHKHSNEEAENLISNGDIYYEDEYPKTYSEIIEDDYDRIVDDELEYEQGHDPTKHENHEHHEEHHEHHEFTEDEYMEGFKKGWHQGVTAGENESLDTNFQAWVLQKQREYEKWSDEARAEEREEHELHHDGGVIVPNTINYSPTDIEHCNPLGVKWSRKFPVEGEGFLIRITDSATTI